MIPATLLRLATWQASRFGVETNLLHPFLHRPSPAADIVVAALEHAQEPLTQAGDFDAVSAGLGRIMARARASACRGPPMPTADAWPTSWPLQ
ncbi:hypothetical protein [Arthrobacter ulcerisalmonis]|uniref:hypothetical protein n=1 Tax=Arthrobacter ulcerisalmonis TaxID=2483813 RepID=UPI003625A445